MNETYRSLFRHFAVYGIGQVLGRLTSVVLLPLYTRCLTPTDYGIIAILDLTVSFFGILVSQGIVGGIKRYHFDAETAAAQSEIWWTGLTFLVILVTGVAAIAWSARSALADITFGPDLTDGTLYYSLALGTFWFGGIGELCESYLRVQKRSVVLVCLSMLCLLLNIGLNVYFLLILNLGITGLLLGNLIAGIVRSLTFFFFFLCRQQRYTVHWPLIFALWRYGAPLIVTAFLATVLHRADIYLLKLYVDLEQIGIYSLAYTIGLAVNTLVLMPFTSIWGVEIYEIARRPNAKDIYVQVFKYFVYGLLLLMLGVSLFARPILELLSTAAYAPAADLVPVICLAYLFYSLHIHFKVPVMLTRQTVSLLPAHLIAAGVNIGANLFAIPLFGTVGAAWVSVLTFVTFSFVGLNSYRMIDRYDYPFAKSGMVLAGMIVSYAGCRIFETIAPSHIWGLGAAVFTWGVWALFLFGPFIRRLVTGHKNFLPGLREYPVDV